MKVGITAYAILLLFLLGGVTAVRSADKSIQQMMQDEIRHYQLFAGSSDGGGYTFGDDEHDDDDSDEVGRKSATKAFALSLLVPGTGQYYTGNGRTARYYWAVEALSWLAWIGFRTYGDWKEDDYIRYAADHAGADLEGKSDWFVDMVGFYDDLNQYNELGRAVARERPYLAPTANNQWQWQSVYDKFSFRQIKNRSREAYRRADFMLGVMLINRLVSAIHATHLAKQTGKRLDDLVDAGNGGGLQYRVEADPFTDGVQLGLTVFKKF